MSADPLAQLRADLAGATAAAGDGSAEPRLDRPRQAGFGDYSTNAAMLLAPLLGDSPRAIAERLGESLGDRLGEHVERVEVAGPGFLNLFMTDAWYLGALAEVLAAGDGFGAGAAGRSERVNVEFVSANPTGPITVASGRHAAYGDALARILEYVGHDVEREFYVNDAGGQIQRFGQSIRARARGDTPPEDGYHGEYVTELAAAIDGAAEMDLDELAARGVELILEGVRTTLDRFRVRMDRYSLEHDVHPTVDEVLGRLDGVYDSDGATWLRTTAHGDDKDRVLRRSNGELTYFAVDIAYHADKLARGYDRAIAIWGADHHGHIKRMKIAWEELGGDPDRFEIVIMQLVNLTEGGARVQMSKRAGTVVRLDDLLDDIGVDAARWFLLQRSHDTTLDVDLELARSQSQDNPVYYVQYAHARIAGILAKAGEDAVRRALATDLTASPEQLHPSARTLVKRLLDMPDELRDAAERRAPHRLTAYAHETAQEFSAFYRDVKVVGAADEGGDEAVRLAVCVAAKRVLARSLDLLGVAAPESM
ncbi:MAG: arginine--tRNA ligase [Thermoleophilaceae bacterium]|nr:arginine--tRNA ligase [Thermoleophilaceae bacterium]